MIEEFCQCGNGISHPKVTHQTHYSKWGWFLFTILGLSARPTLVSFQCTICNEIFHSTNNKEMLKKFIGR